MPGLNDPHLPRGLHATEAPSQSSQADETGVATERIPPGVGPTLGPPAAPGEVGTLGPYRLVKELGRGGMGAVYAALDTRLDRRLALKLMLPEFAADPAARERFVREARAAAQVGHDHVVTVFEADVRDGVPYIAMPFLEGYPLDEYLKRKGNPSLPQVLRIGREAAAGLAAAHAKGLVHRDIKPANLWLEAPNGRVKLLDFGLARPVDAEAELTRQGAIVGTPAYMSPEQARGEKVDHRTDLFSLGVVLYRLCTGRLPFQGASTMAVLIALGTEDPPPVREVNPAVPEPLAALVHQLLAKAPAGRPKSADEVAARLLALARPAAPPAERSQPQVSAPSQPQVVFVPIQVTAAPEANPFAELDATEAESVPEAAPAVERRKPRKRWLVAGGLAALVLAVFGGVIIVIRNRDGTETKIEVPDGATVTVKDTGGKTLAQVGPPAKAPVADESVDRRAAEWVLSAGGKVQVDSVSRDIQAAADLPKDRFALTAVNLKGTTAVTDGGLAALEGCTGLKTLNLYDTGVSDAGLAHLNGLTALTTLYLDRTKVTDAGLAHLKGLTALADLQLNGTDVSDAGLAHLKDLTALTNLNLGGTRNVTGAGLAHLKGLTGLTKLYLDRSGVTDAGLAHVKGLTGLTHLNLLAAAKVTDAGLAQLKGLTGLTGLHLTGTKVTDAGLAHLRDCEALKTLWLANTRVTDAGLGHLRGCRTLTQIDLKQTKVTAKGVADFHASVPGCRIEHDGGVIEPVDVDRAAAEWALGLGGTVRVNGGEQKLKTAAELPAGRLTLTNLNLRGADVSDAGLARLAGCGGLKVLDAGGTKVTDAGLVHLGGLKQLDNLTLDNTAVTDAGLAHLRGCEALGMLSFQATKVTGTGLAELRGLKRLWFLNLNHSAVTDAGLTGLKDLPELSQLHIQQAKVTDAGLAHLRECKGLTHLDVARVRAATATWLAAFHAAAPGCRVVHDGGVIEPKK